MKIAQIASNFIRTPPTPRYVPKGCSGAAELVIHLLTEELVKRGHKVTLFAAGNSKTKARLISSSKGALSQDKKIVFHLPFEHLHVSKAYQVIQKENFDIIHSHIPYLTGFYAPLCKTPTVATIHFPIGGAPKQILEKFYDLKFNLKYISISNAQRKDLPQLNYVATVYHGINIDRIPYSFQPGEYLIFVGRIAPEKGVLEAIKVAKKCKEKLLILGSYDPKNPDQRKYWAKIKPFVDNKQIIYLGFLSRREVFSYLKKAKALIFPVKWEEPFGLTTIEALACGTPTITYSRGSLSELIKHGQTGFLVKNLKEMTRAVKDIGIISRSECRKYAQNFTIERMVDNYEKVYKKILKA